MVKTPWLLPLFVALPPSGWLLYIDISESPGADISSGRCSRPLDIMLLGVARRDLSGEKALKGEPRSERMLLFVASKGNAQQLHLSLTLVLQNGGNQPRRLRHVSRWHLSLTLVLQNGGKSGADVGASQGRIFR